MGIGIKRSPFGRKGVSGHAKSFAESLLSGKPLARAPEKDRSPKLKPRPKAKFGRRQVSEQVALGRNGVKSHLNWKFWAILLSVLALGI